MPRTQLAEPFERRIKGAEVVEFLRRRRTSLDDVGSEDEQPSQVRLEGEREVRRTRAPNRSAVLRVLGRVNGNLSKAADLLGVSRPTLYDLMHRFGLK